MLVSNFNNRRLTVAILTLSDKRLIETDLLKTGFLFEFSSFPCTFDLMFQHHNYSGVEIKNGEYTQVITKTLYCMSNN